MIIKSTLTAIAAITIASVTPVAADPVDGTVSLGTSSFATLVGVPATPMSQAEERSVLGAGTIITTPDGKQVIVIPDLVSFLHAAIICVERVRCTIPTDTPSEEQPTTFSGLVLDNN